MNLLWSAILLLLISGTLCELPRLIVPFSNSFKIISYGLLPAYFLVCTNFGIRKIRLKIPKPFLTVFAIILLPLLVVYFIELQQKIFLSISYVKIQAIFTMTFAIILFLFFPKNLKEDHNALETRLKMILAPYLYFCIFNSFIGVIAFIAISTNIIELTAWEIPNFLLKSGFSSGRNDYVSMPFFLTLVHDKLYAGFHRYNGLSIEPHTYALFTSPAYFFLTIFSMIIKKDHKGYKSCYGISFDLNV